jgi:hypothetical protein
MNTHLLRGGILMAGLIAAGVAWRGVVPSPGTLPPEDGTRAFTPTEVRVQPEPDPDEAALLALGATDPLEALHLARRYLDGVAYERVLAACLEQLLVADPVAAARVVATLPAGDFLQVAAGRVARELARRHPEEALAWAQSLQDDAARLRATREAMGTWAGMDPAAASRSVPLLRSERERALAALAVVTAWVRSDALAALAWSRASTSGETHALVLSAALKTWAERDAAAAMYWLSLRPDDLAGENARQARLGILMQWAKQDATAAQQFVSSLPEGEQAGAAGAIAPHLAQADPIGTMQWALSLGNRELSETAFMHAFRRWREIAPAEAQQWLVEAALTPEEKFRLAGYP